MKMLSNKYFNVLSNISNVRTQKLIGIVLTSTALSLFGLFAINPTLSTIAKLRKEIADYEIINQKLGEKISALSSLQQAYSRLESEVPTVISAVPESPLVPLFIGQIQSLAIGSNIQLSQLQNSQVDLFKEEGESQKYYAYSFTLSGDGIYEDLTKFIENIVNMQRIVGVDVSSINNTENSSRSLRINIQGATYYKK